MGGTRVTPLGGRVWFAGRVEPARAGLPAASVLLLFHFQLRILALQVSGSGAQSEGFVYCRCVGWQSGWVRKNGDTKREDDNILVHVGPQCVTILVGGNAELGWCTECTVSSLV